MLLQKSECLVFIKEVIKYLEVSRNTVLNYIAGNDCRQLKLETVGRESPLRLTNGLKKRIKNKVLFHLV